MDPIFKAVFPILLIGIIAIDWPALRKLSAGVKTVYFVLTASSVALFAVRAAGIEPYMPTRFFILYVSPAVERLLGLK